MTEMNEDLTQASIEPLLAYFDRLIPLNKEEKELVKEKFHSRLFRKKQYVLQEGNVCTQFYFIVRGCLRMYKIDEKGSTHILQFAAENYWINDLGSFHGVKPSSLNIDALEDTVLSISCGAKAVRQYSKIIRLSGCVGYLSLLPERFQQP